MPYPHCTASKEVNTSTLKNNLKRFVIRLINCGLVFTLAADLKGDGCPVISACLMAFIYNQNVHAAFQMIIELFCGFFPVVIQMCPF